MSAYLHLDAESVEAIARRTAEILRGEPITNELIDVAEVARRFGVKPQWVRDHALELGGVKIASGPKAHWRFDPAAVAEALRTPARPVGEDSPTRTHRRHQSPSAAGLLPIRGERP